MHFCGCAAGAARFWLHAKLAGVGASQSRLGRQLQHFNYNATPHLRTTTELNDVYVLCAAVTAVACVCVCVSVNHDIWACTQIPVRTLLDTIFLWSRSVRAGGAHRFYLCVITFSTQTSAAATRMLARTLGSSPPVKRHAETTASLLRVCVCVRALPESSSPLVFRLAAARCVCT